MGRKPLPTKLKLIRGTAQKCRLNPNEPTPSPEIPEAPAHLQGLALAEWNRVTPKLLKMGILADIDGSALAGYCQAFKRWVEAEREIEDEGMVTTTEKGYLVQNPCVGIANKAMETMRKFLVEFGMTPASRSKVSAKKPEEENNPWAQFKRK